MIRFSVDIMRGCFGGCTFCSITEHEGRIIQNRSEESILREIERIRDTAPGVHRRHLRPRRTDRQHVPAGVQEPQDRGRLPPALVRLSGYLREPATPTTRRSFTFTARRAPLPGVKKVLIGSRACATTPRCARRTTCRNWWHTTSAAISRLRPNTSRKGRSSKMMKPGIGTYDKFKALFDKFSREAGKKQYLIPYFIAAHPGTTDEDMLALALWLKQQRFPARPGADVPARAAGGMPRRCTTRARIRCTSSDVRQRERGDTEGPSRCGALHSAFPGTTTRPTGRCCARGLAAHGAQSNSSVRASINSSRLRRKPAGLVMLGGARPGNTVSTQHTGLRAVAEDRTRDAQPTAENRRCAGTRAAVTETPAAKQ